MKVTSKTRVMRQGATTMDTDSDKAWAAMSKFAVYLFLVAPVLALLGAWALRDLWLWFVVPLGVPALGLAQAAGIRLLASYLAFQYPLRRKDGEGGEDPSPSIAHICLTGVLVTLVAWGFGWAIHQLG